MKIALFILCLGLTAHADKLSDDFKKFGQSVKSAGKEIGEKGKELGQAVGKEAKKAGNEAAESTKDIRSDVKDGAKETGGWFSNMGRKIGDSWNSFWRGDKPAKPKDDFN